MAHVRRREEGFCKARKHRHRRTHQRQSTPCPHRRIVTSRTRLKPAKESGFTLIEVMLVVVILGILTAVAVPSFTRYLASSKRPEAIMFLSAIANAQEVYFTENEQFSDSFDALYMSIEGATNQTATTMEGPRYSYALSQPNGINTWYCTARPRSS